MPFAFWSDRSTDLHAAGSLIVAGDGTVGGDIDVRETLRVTGAATGASTARADVAFTAGAH